MLLFYILKARNAKGHAQLHSFLPRLVECCVFFHQKVIYSVQKVDRIEQLLFKLHRILTGLFSLASKVRTITNNNSSCVSYDIC